jgi:hypothetical protein
MLAGHVDLDELDKWLRIGWERGAFQVLRRVALGAASRDVLALALRQGLLVVAGGIVVGLAGAVAATRVLANVLGMQRAGDPLVFASMTLLLSLVALAACVLPAHRATRISTRHCVTSEDRLLTA